MKEFNPLEKPKIKDNSNLINKEIIDNSFNPDPDNFDVDSLPEIINENTPSQHIKDNQTEIDSSFTKKESQAYIAKKIKDKIEELDRKIENFSPKFFKDKNKEFAELQSLKSKREDALSELKKIIISN